ncbi:hypothetical protein ES703_74082 [subsurface metagenome]
MRDPARLEVINSIIQGIRKAQEDYKKAYMSHICSSYAPEYLMTVYIFQSILELKEECNCTYGLSLEEPVKELATSLGARPRYPKDARVYGYCDLLLRDINDKPRAAIEVKKYAWDYPEDLGRLAYLVEKGLEFGVFASCWFEEVKDNNHKEAEDRLKEEIQCIHEHIRKHIRRRYNKLLIERELGNIERLVLEGETLDQKEESRWCPVCFVVYRKEDQ